MMRAALVLPGGPKWPDLTKCQKYGITRLHYTANDPQVDAAFFDAIRKSSTNPNGVEVGIMYGPNWDNYPAPETVASRMDQYVRDLGANAKQMAVMLDQEQHDSDYVLAILQAWRVLRPTRPTIWTLEGHQNWISVDLANFINADHNLLVAPQLYTGANGSIDEPIAGGPELRRYAMSRPMGGMGIYPSRVLEFISPRFPLEAWWEGFLYLENWAQLP